MRSSMFFPSLAVVWLAATGTVASAQTGTWSTTGNMSTSRFLHTTTRLADGRVLVAAGVTQGFEPLVSAELYDPAGETWTATGSLGHSRDGHSATLLPNGLVLAVSGSTSPIMGVPSSELYDAGTGSWRDSGDVVVSRMLHPALLLPTGEVF